MRNESTIDRAIRLLVAVIAAGAAFTIGAGTVGGLVLLGVGTIMLLTAAIGFCPLYRLFGISTCKVPAGR